jgi:hypothetical protein
VRALMPSQSKRRGAKTILALQLGAGSGKGQNPALVLRTIAQAKHGSEADLQSIAAGWRWPADQTALASSGDTILNYCLELMAREC